MMHLPHGDRAKEFDLLWPVNQSNPSVDINFHYNTVAQHIIKIISEVRCWYRETQKLGFVEPRCNWCHKCFMYLMTVSRPWNASRWAVADAGCSEKGQTEWNPKGWSTLFDELKAGVKLLRKGWGRCKNLSSPMHGVRLEPGRLDVFIHFRHFMQITGGSRRAWLDRSLDGIQGLIGPRRHPVWQWDLQRPLPAKDLAWYTSCV